MRFRRGFGIILFFVGVFLLVGSQSGMTGDVVSEKASALSSVFGLVFIVGGLVLMLMSLEKNLAQQIRESGKIITKPRELKKIARKTGYNFKNVKEGTQVLDDEGNVITVIPNHDVTKGVYYSIITSLATGESSFRRYAR